MSCLRSTASFSVAVLASLATGAALSDPAAAETRSTPQAETPREVKLEQLNDTTVCRRERPTGSKIAVKRCYARGGPDTPQHSVANDITRRDFEALRQQQVYYEQVRQAQQAALRQQALQRAQH